MLIRNHSDSLSFTGLHYRQKVHGMQLNGTARDRHTRIHSTEGLNRQKGEGEEQGKKEEDFVVGKGLTRVVISDWAKASGCERGGRRSVQNVCSRTLTESNEVLFFHSFLFHRMTSDVFAQILWFRRI